MPMARRRWASTQTAHQLILMGRRCTLICTNTEYTIRKNPGGFRLTDHNFIMMRYADVLLLLAEAEVRTSGDLERARDLVNQIRERAGAPSLDESDISNDNADDLLQAIVDEREVELVSEQVRSRDLRRWHAAGIVDAESILGYSVEKFLLPIPQNEIINNVNILPADQNPGYSN